MILLAAGPCAAADGTFLGPLFTEQVTRRLDLPEPEQRTYAALAADLATRNGITGAQYVLAVDRSKFVQAALLYWMAADCSFHLIGASPVSTGKPGTFDHFETPTGVFEHTTANPDFRAEGTRNALGIRGYGVKGMRVFDFGWQQGVKGWGKGGEGTMRLQMHATDPTLLEKRLGSIQSKGCIRIPASLNVFLDRYGILDGDYEQEMAAGKTFWVLSKAREPTPWPGRFLIVVETPRTARPSWSSLPGNR